ncbi:MAG: protein BatD [Acidobacteriota bacterium]|nr:MAG: protein BatD [Acidobacteriota bacterium]
MNRMRTLLLLFGAAAWLSAPVGARDISVSAGVDAPKIGVEDTLTLTVTVTGSVSGVTQPDVASALEDFHVRGQSSSMQATIMNFEMVQSHQFHYTLLPKREGMLRIPGLQVVVKGRTYRTEPIVVSVQSGSLKPRRQSPQQRRSPFVSPWDPWGERRQQRGVSDDELRRGVRVQGWLSRSRAYVGEPVVVHYRLLSRWPLLGATAVETPTFEGFVTEDIVLPATRTSDTVEQDGKRYYALPVLEKVLVPTQSGTFSIEPLVLEVRVQLGQAHWFFSMGASETVHRRSPTLTVEVQPLPEPVPDDFNGALGQFSLKETLSAEEVDASEALTFTVSVQGRGNLRSLAPPVFPPLPGFTVHEPEVSYNVKPSPAKGLHGAMKATYLLIPRTTGTQLLPMLTMSVFNPETQAYERLATKSHQVHVRGTITTKAPVLLAPAMREVETLATDIHYIRPEVPLHVFKESFAPLYRRPAALAIALGLPLVLNAAAIGAVARQRRLREDEKGYRARRAGRTASRRFAEARAAFRRSDAPRALEALDEGLRGYAADKTGRSPDGLTARDIFEEFRAARVDERRIREYGELMEAAHAGLYSPAGQRLDAEAAEKAGKLVRTIEREWKSKRAQA